MAHLTIIIWILQFGCFNLANGHWKTVDILNSATVASASYGNSIDRFDAVYVFGSRGTQWVVRKSQNQAKTQWQTVDSFNLPEGKRAISWAGCNQGAFVFAAGSAQEQNGIWHWVVRMSGDSGKTWQTVDDAKAPQGYMPTIRRISVDSKGRIFARDTSKVRRTVYGSSAAAWTVAKRGSPLTPTGPSQRVTQVLLGSHLTAPEGYM